MRIVTATLCALLIVPVGLASPKRKETTLPRKAVAIEQVMSAKEFKAAGLDKLTASELAALNRWLAGFTASLVSPQTGNTSGEVIESYIDGDFEGWSGETIFKLDNGQIWQQASYSYTYEYAYHPKVMIYRSGGEYHLKVEDVEETIPVKRLK